MKEQLLDTIEGIINYELPKNSQGNAVVYDRKIEGWYFGDTDISGAKDPAIILSATSGTGKTIGFGTKEVEHKVTIKLFVKAASVEKGDRNILEFTRLIYEALLPHTMLWVLTPCPMCRKKIFSPQHYTIVHNDILSTYVDSINNDFTTLWQSTHPNTITPPDLADSGVAAAAFLKMYDDVRNNVTVNHLDTPSKDNIQKMIETKRRPVRLMYDVSLTDVKDTDGGVGKQNLHGGEFTLTAKELVKLTAFGPDNVPTDAYALQLNK